MAGLNLTTLELAKAYQWDMTFVQDPVDLAYRGHNAVFDLRQKRDESLCEGSRVRIHAFSAFAIEQWNEELKGFVTTQFDEIVADGESLGLSFIQHAPDPDLTTIFLGLRSVALRELERRPKGQELVMYDTPRLVLPILDVDSVEIVAA